MKSKEEIFEAHCKSGMYGTTWLGYEGSCDEIYAAMQEYADQQTEELKACLSDMLSVIDNLPPVTMVRDRFAKQYEAARKLLNKQP